VRLGVRLILDGSATADDRNFQVSLHVDDTVNHLTLWSGRFTGPAERPEELKTSVAATAVAVLSCSAAGVAPHGLSDPQALTFYLQACDLAERDVLDPGAREQLFGALRQVTQRAPRFVPGLAMRAEQLAAQALCCGAEETDTLRSEARTDANRALAIEPTNSRALSALSLLLPPADWQGREAILRRALKTDPDSPWANGYLGQVLAEVGRIQEAADAMRKANAVNPLTLDWSADSARMSAMAGRAQEALDEAAQVAKSWPNDPYARVLRLEVAATESDWSEEYALLDGGRLGLSPAQTEAVRSAAQALANPIPMLRAKARADLIGVVDQPGGLQFAIVLSRLGFVNDAFNALQVYQPRDPAGTQSGFLFTPEAANMRRDPRFMQLATRIGLTRYWRSTGNWPDFCAEPGLPYDCKTEAERLATGHG
jgi:tetratricopeptide (TPR) repeat protein